MINYLFVVTGQLWRYLARYEWTVKLRYRWDQSVVLHQYRPSESWATNVPIVREWFLLRHASLRDIRRLYIRISKRKNVFLFAIYYYLMCHLLSITSLQMRYENADVSFRFKNIKIWPKIIIIKFWLDRFDKICGNRFSRFSKRRC